VESEFRESEELRSGLEAREAIRRALAPALVEVTSRLLRLQKERLANDDDLGTASGPLVTRMAGKNGLIDPVIQGKPAKRNAD
jgi:hypothetical protein